MTDTIRYLKIANYRSIDVLELHDIKPFSVFAGPNGSGKSNFFDALDFVNLVIRFGADEALKKHGGFDNVRCLRRTDEPAHRFEFEIEVNLTQQPETIKYHLEIDELDTSPTLTESLLIGDKRVTKQDLMEVINSISITDNFGRVGRAKRNPMRPPPSPNQESNQVSMFSILPHSISQFLKNIRLYRIEPFEARTPVKNRDISELNHTGRNLAGVLHRLQTDVDTYETLCEWMELVVPGLEKVFTDVERVDGSIQLTFKEQGLEKPFPAHFVSDGTIYLLGVVCAMLDRPAFGMTLIEEAERGLHPHAIIELVGSFRDRATVSSPIWVTTHNEALVRVLKNNELWLVDKKQGNTQMKPIREYDASDLSLDQAWLCNVLNGGLPW